MNAQRQTSLVLTWSLGLSALLLTHCAPKRFLHADYQKMKPVTVVVLPPENLTSNDDVESIAYPILYEKLSNRKYYCISPELVRAVFNANRMENAGKINELPAQKMKEVFDADAVLKTRITEWSTKYIVISSNVTITLELEMVDTKTGETLWSIKNTVSKAPGNSGGGFIGAMISAAMHAAMQQYEPIMDENAASVVATVPFGDYGKKAAKK